MATENRAAIAGSQAQAHTVLSTTAVCHLFVRRISTVVGHPPLNKSSLCEIRSQA